MGSSRRDLFERLVRWLPTLLASILVLAGVTLLLLNTVVVNDPGPLSGEPRDYVTVWPAGIVLLGVGSAGLMAGALLVAADLAKHSRL